MYTKVHHRIYKKKNKSRRYFCLSHTSWFGVIYLHLLVFGSAREMHFIYLHMYFILKTFFYNFYINDSVLFLSLSHFLIWCYKFTFVGLCLGQRGKYTSVRTIYEYEVCDILCTCILKKHIFNYSYFIYHTTVRIF